MSTSDGTIAQVAEFSAGLPPAATPPDLEPESGIVAANFAAFNEGLPGSASVAPAESDEDLVAFEDEPEDNGLDVADVIARYGISEDTIGFLRDGGYDPLYEAGLITEAEDEAGVVRNAIVAEHARHAAESYGESLEQALEEAESLLDYGHPGSVLADELAARFGAEASYAFVQRWQEKEAYETPVSSAQYLAQQQAQAQAAELARIHAGEQARMQLAIDAEQARLAMVNSEIESEFGAMERSVRGFGDLAGRMAQLAQGLGIQAQTAEEVPVVMRHLALSAQEIDRAAAEQYVLDGFDRQFAMTASALKHGNVTPPDPATFEARVAERVDPNYLSRPLTVAEQQQTWMAGFDRQLAQQDAHRAEVADRPGRGMTAAQAKVALRNAIVGRNGRGA